MWPFSYSRWATRMVVCEENRSLRLASCCSVEVMNGAAGERRYGFSSTERTAKLASASPSARERTVGSSSTTDSVAALPLSRPSGPKSRPAATRRPSRATSRAGNAPGSSTASRSQ